MKKKKVVQLHFTEEGLDQWAKSQKIPNKKHVKMIIDEAKDTAKHFDGHDWDLNLDSMLSQLKIDLLGYNPEWLFFKTLVQNVKRPLYIHHRDGSVISLSVTDKKKAAIGTFKMSNTSAAKKPAKKKVRK